MDKNTKPMVLLGDSHGRPLPVRLSVVDDDAHGHDLTLVASTSGGVTGLRDGGVIRLDPSAWPDGEMPEEIVLAVWGACDS